MKHTIFRHNCHINPLFPDVSLLGLVHRYILYYFKTILKYTLTTKRLLLDYTIKIPLNLLNLWLKFLVEMGNSIAITMSTFGLRKKI